MNSRQQPNKRASHLTVDLSVEGKQHGFYNLPLESSLGTVQIPICVIKNGEGATTALVAGLHGDQYDGQIALQKLAKELDIDAISGTVIIVPSANAPSVAKGTATSPLDKLDIDDCFPGNPDGSISEQIAAALITVLIDPCDTIIDLRSGGNHNNYTPTASVPFNKDKPDVQSSSEQHMIAFGAPFSARTLPVRGLGAEATAREKNYVCVYLGGGGSCSKSNIDIAMIGCRNVLIQQGILDSELILRSTRMLETREEANFVIAPASGHLELCCELGGDVFRGNPLAHIHDSGRTGQPPITIKADRNGILMARHSSGKIRQGECIAIVADEVQG